MSRSPRPNRASPPGGPARPAQPRERIIALKPQQVAGVCPLVDDGAPCTRPVKVRGLCSPHRLYLKSVGRLEELAAPSRAGKKSVFVVDPDAPEGICWIIQDGRPCVRRARPQGICGSHRSVLHKRPDLPLEQLTRRRQDVTYARKKRPEPGLCVVREQRPVPGQARGRSVPCPDSSVSRGLCQRHRHRLAGNPALFAQLADPVRRGKDFRLKSRLVEGVCVIVEDDVGCSLRTTHQRRVCDLHRVALRRAGRLAELTGRFVSEAYTFARKPPHAFVPGFCSLLVNGVPCTNQPLHRGLCKSCYHLVRKHADYEALAFPLAVKKERELARCEQPVRGGCVLVIDGKGCQEVAVARGLCRPHYRLASRTKRLDELGLSLEELGRLPKLLHLYLDKNVPIRFALYETFGVAPERSSIAIVEAALARRVRATVSLDCVRAVYSHLGHRLARPAAEGGKDLDDAAAERAARDYVGALFFGRGGAWSFAAPTEEAFSQCSLGGRLPELSLEDALEVHLYAAARERGAELFVTADGGVLEYGEAVHPRRVVETYAHLFP